MKMKFEKGSPKEREALRREKAVESKIIHSFVHDIQIEDGYVFFIIYLK